MDIIVSVFLGIIFPEALVTAILMLTGKVDQLIATLKGHMRVEQRMLVLLLMMLFVMLYTFVQAEYKRRFILRLYRKYRAGTPVWVLANDPSLRRVSSELRMTAYENFAEWEENGGRV